MKKVSFCAKLRVTPCLHLQNDHGEDSCLTKHRGKRRLCKIVSTKVKRLSVRMRNRLQLDLQVPGKVLVASEGTLDPLELALFALRLIGVQGPATLSMATSRIEDRKLAPHRPSRISGRKGVMMKEA